MQNSKDLKSKLINASPTILIIFMCIDDPEDARKECKAYLNAIDVTLTTEEIQTLSKEMINLLKSYEDKMPSLESYEDKMPSVKLADMKNLISQTEGILQGLFKEDQEPAPQPADYKSYITSQKEASKNTEHHL